MCHRDCNRPFDSYLLDITDNIVISSSILPPPVPQKNSGNSPLLKLLFLPPPPPPLPKTITSTSKQILFIETASSQNIPSSSFPVVTPQNIIVAVVTTMIIFLVVIVTDNIPVKITLQTMIVSLPDDMRWYMNDRFDTFSKNSITILANVEELEEIEEVDIFEAEPVEINLNETNDTLSIDTSLDSGMNPMIIEINEFFSLSKLEYDNVFSPVEKSTLLQLQEITVGQLFSLAKPYDQFSIQVHFRAYFLLKFDDNTKEYELFLMPFHRKMLLENQPCLGRIRRTKEGLSFKKSGIKTTHLIPFDMKESDFIETLIRIIYH